MFKRRKTDEPSATTAKADAPGASEALLDGGLLATPPRRPEAGMGAAPVRPPLFPAAAKEQMPMGRSPFTAPPAPNAPPPGGVTGMPAPPGAGRPGPAAAPNRPAAPAERRTLVVGTGISVQGTVTDAERLVVQGTVEASMIHAAELAIAEGGVFKGEVEVEDTEVAGTMDGTLTARGNLVVRATGKVLGTARCRRLQVEDGGQITGRIEMLTEGGPAARSAAEPARAMAEPPLAG